MGLSTPTVQSQPAVDPYGIKSAQTSSTQQGVSLIYFAGEARVAVNWVSPPYNVRTKEVKSNSGGGKGGGGNSVTGYKYYVDIIGLACLGPVDHIFTVIIDDDPVWAGFLHRSDNAEVAEIALPGEDGTLRVYWGTDTAQPPNWFPTAGDVHPAYRGMCRVELHNFFLGSEGRTDIPNVEIVVGRAPAFFEPYEGYVFNSGGNPAGIIYELLTNTRYGLAQPISIIDQTNFANFSQELFVNSLWANPVLDASDTLQSLLSKLFEYYDGWIRKLGGVYQIGLFPKGTPAPVGTLTDDDFLSEPKHVSTTLEDVTNAAMVTFTDCTSFYNDNVVRFDDQGSKALVGGVTLLEQRQEPWFVNAGLCFNWAMQYVLMKSRPQITGTVEVRKESADAINPGDVYTIASNTLGFSIAARITSKTVSADSDGKTTLEYTEERGDQAQLFAATPPNYHEPIVVAPLDITKFRIVDLPNALKSTVDPEIAVLAEQPEAQMLRFRVNVTQDLPSGVQSFQQLSPDCGFSIHGTLVNSYGLTADPDLTVGPLILATGNGSDQLVTQSATNRDNYEWLIWIDNEIMSMGAVVARGGGKYNMQVRRGIYGTVQAQHFAGADVWIQQRAKLSVLTNGSFTQGSTWFFKLVGYNINLGYDISTTNNIAYTFRQGNVSLQGPSNLVVGTEGSRVVFNWKADTSPTAAGYEIRFGPVGGNWQQARRLITEISSSHTVAEIVPPGTWVFYVASIDTWGDYSSSVATQTFAVPNLFKVVESNYGKALHALDVGTILDTSWGAGNGAIFTNCFVHPTAHVLVPKDGVSAWYTGPDNGYDIFDSFCVSPPSLCEYTSPTQDSLGLGTTLRPSVVPYEYLFGLSNLPPDGVDIINDFNSTPTGWTYTNCFMHPTASAVVPKSTHSASFKPSGGTGYELFDNFCFAPSASMSVSIVQDAGAIYPWDAELDTRFLAGYGQGLPNGSSSIAWSNIQTGTYNIVATGASGGSLQATAIGRYVKYTATLNNSGSVGFISAFSADTTVGPPDYWTSIDPQISTSPDNVTYGPFADIPSLYTTDRYVQFKVSWNPFGGKWPVGLSSMWTLLDVPQQVLSNNSVAVPIGGLAVTYSQPFRVIVAPTATPVASSAQYAIIIGSSLTGFTVQLFNAAGAAIAGVINWHAIGF